MLSEPQVSIGPPTDQTSGFDQPGGLLTEDDSALLGGVEQAVAEAVALQHWWEAVDRAGAYSDKFQIMRTFNPADTSFGFFDVATLPGDRELPVMGVFQDLSYDRPKAAEAMVYRDQLRAFVLRYFMRVSDYRAPEAFVDENREGRGLHIPGLSWCPRPGDTRQGFGYRQLFYKLRRSGRVGKFPPAQQGAIVDLREIGPIYEWIVASVRIFDFTLTFRPFGGEQPYLTIPLSEETPIVLAKPFIRAVDDPGPGLLAEYGFGYAVLRNPLARGPLVYGPGRFGPGFQLIDFKIRDSGEIRVCLTFVINRPQQILDVPLDPFTWSAQLANLVSLGLTSRVFAPFYALLQQTSRAAPGFDPIFGYVDLVNALTGGRAAEDLCISRVQLEKDMLVQHFMQHYTLITGSLMTWRQVPDWLSPELPAWVLSGRGL